MAIKRVTWEESKNFPKMTSLEIKELENHVDTDFSDCLPLTTEQVMNGSLLREAHPEWYKPTKTRISISLDSDLLAVLKSQGKGYQPRINAILRKAVMGAWFYLLRKVFFV